MIWKKVEGEIDYIFFRFPFLFPTYLFRHLSPPPPVQFIQTVFIS